MRNAPSNERMQLTKRGEDAELLNCSNAVWLSVTRDYTNLSGAFVIVEGQFTTKGRGHLGAWPGELRDIRRLERMRTRADYERMRQETQK
ncbi:MAG: hypothetical protein AB7N24_23935 [Dehalococcoidia bacterium]